MPRKPVPILANEIYHIFNRGVDKRVVFSDKADYVRFYTSLHKFNNKESGAILRLARPAVKEEDKLVKVISYCLLPNHFHLIVEAVHDGSVSEYMQKVCGGYTSYFNSKYERSGSLFQGTYKRVHVNSDEQLNYLVAYVNENHIVHNLTRGGDIFYTSSLHYSGKTKSALLTDNVYKNYDIANAQKLASEINQKRLLRKSETLE